MSGEATTMGPGEFLSALFQDKPEALWILVWHLETRKSHWFRDPAAAAKAALKLKNNVYVGCALSPEDRGESRRGEASTTAGIGALWADVDFAGTAHNKPGLPLNEAAACALLEAMPLKPSFVLHTGHGLQAWWLLQEFWLFEDDSDRARAKSLVRGWVDLLQRYAGRHGWVVDPVGDLARVMRIPGTMNVKQEPHRKVQLLSNNEHLLCDLKLRHHVHDFEAFTSSAGLQQIMATPSFNHLSLALDGQANPPYNLFNALAENDDRFKATWERTRRDLNDKSPSGWDMALASLSARANWSDQDIVNLLIAHRRKYGDPLKLDRLDYYQRTIAKAREGIKVDAAEETVAGFAESPGAVAPGKQAAPVSDDPDAPVPDAHGDALAALSELLGIRVHRFVRLMAAQPEFRIETEFGGIDLGGVGTVTSQTQFRNQIAALTKQLIPKQKAPAWERTVRVLLSVCEDVSIGAEATDEGMALGWLTGYIDENERYLTANADLSEAIKGKYPFHNEAGDVCFFLTSFQYWIKTSRDGGGVAVSAKEIGKKLRACGCVPDTIRPHRSTRHVWVIPAEIAAKLKHDDRPAVQPAAH